ncbi:MAG TPA: GNAT family N-acetyltransferase [Microvirga sp.]|nr:GNAT family N-acetyltransferase [Microvirga sp.]
MTAPAGDDGVAPQPEMLRTERLTLRRWREADLEPFRRINADPEVMRFLVGTQTPEASDASARRLMGFAESDGLGPWAVEVPGEAPFVGFVGCWPTRPQLPFAPAIEVGWRLDRAVWGRGYAPEAARAALADAFGRARVPEVVAYTAAGNAPSRQVMAKLGMRHDPAEDFDHFMYAADDPHRRCVVYRLSAGAFQGLSGP